MIVVPPIAITQANLVATNAVDDPAFALGVTYTAGDARSLGGRREVVRTGRHAGFCAGGLALVGERGPELINFSQPGQVFTNEQTRGMFSGVGNSGLESLVQSLISEVQALRLEARATASHTNKTAKIFGACNARWHQPANGGCMKVINPTAMSATKRITAAACGANEPKNFTQE